MAKKKNDNVLTMAPPTSDFSNVISTNLVPLSSFRRSSTGRERRLIVASREQRTAIEVRSALECFADTKVAELHLHCSQTYAETLAQIMAIKDARSGRSQEHQEWIDFFTERQRHLFLEQSLGMIEVGGAAIAMEANAPWPSPEPKGFAQRLKYLLSD